MGRSNIGELEELILLAIAYLGTGAYGYAIKTSLESDAARAINLSAVHAALSRLETKGLVTSRFGESTKKRGGKRKKYFELTNLGRVAIEESRDVRNRYWEKISVTTNTM